MDDAKVIRGQRAWRRIKATAQEQRELWRDIGEALLVGRRLHKSDKMFGYWIKEKGFDDIPTRTRTDTMWLAGAYSEVTSGLELGVSHPNNIREWYRENVKAQQLPPELQDLTIESRPAIELDQRSAERIAKVIHRAAGDDEGAVMWLAEVYSASKPGLAPDAM